MSVEVYEDYDYKTMSDCLYLKIDGDQIEGFKKGPFSKEEIEIAKPLWIDLVESNRDIYST